MAKTSRGGLGRGLGSLLGNSYTSESAPVQDNPVEHEPEKNRESERPVERTPNRERILYDAREDKTYEIAESLNNTENLENGLTGRFSPVQAETQAVPNNVSRETHPSQTIENSKVIPSIPAKPDKPVSDENVIQEVDIDLIVPNPEQPRTNFNQEDLRELSNSIKREGVIQPILVRKTTDGEFQIIAGERRWQASKLAGKTTVPIQVKNVDDEKALELALIENIQRTDLNPIEEAYGYKRLMERNKMTQADIAQAVSKGRSTIANALRLLELPEVAQQMLFEEKITAGHARAILSVPSKDGRISLTHKLAENKLSVRETENLARLMANKPDKRAPKEPVPAVYKSVARELKAVLDTPVKVRSSKGKNKIEIEFKDERDLERLFELIVNE